MSEVLQEGAAFDEWLVARQEAIDRGDTDHHGDSTPTELADSEAERRAAAERCLLALDSIRRSQWLTALSQESSTGPGNDGPLGDAPGRIGRFEIIRVIGQGGSGVVFQARDPKLGRDVALKVPRPDALLTADLRKRFLREANAAALLSHPGIVPIFEVGAAGPNVFIAAEYCDADSLATWIDRQDEPIEPRVAAELVAELADAIEHAHGRGVLHRDLKPSNVVFADKARQPKRDQLPGRLRITDFGLAKLMATDSTATQTGVVLGTPSYMAPEQADSGIGAQSERTDVYGLGAILYELLTGARPFREESDVSTLIAVRQAEPKQPRRLRPDLPCDLEAICLKCLEKRPKDRYASATDLAADLRRFLAGEPTVARPLAPLQRTIRWVRRNPLAAALMAVIAVSASAMTIGAIWHAERMGTQREENRQLREQADVRERTEVEGGANVLAEETGETKMVVHRARGPVPIDADWNHAKWQVARPIVLEQFMGDRPSHFPKTEARICYDDQALYIMFRVRDRYVRAVATAHQESVCTDSCVEFFFTPGMDPAAGYFNLEMNCGGTMLFHYQALPRKDAVAVTAGELAQIDVAHSLPERVDPEITSATTWTVAYRLPLDMLTLYESTLVRPAPGVTWRANFYKCADKTSHPHWLTWAPVDHPTPDFHVPSSFGVLEFK